jgi:hypothetical protein
MSSPFCDKPRRVQGKLPNVGLKQWESSQTNPVHRLTGLLRSASGLLVIHPEDATVNDGLPMARLSQPERYGQLSWAKWRAAFYVVLFASGHAVSLANTLYCGFNGRVPLRPMVCGNVIVVGKLPSG